MLGLPPAFALSQDQTLKLNELDQASLYELTLIFDEVGQFSITHVIAERPEFRMTAKSYSAVSRSCNQDTARKDSAVHVSLSSIQHVKQRESNRSQPTRK